MEQKPAFASNSNWADDVEAEEAAHGQAPLPIDEILRERPSYAMSPRSGSGGGGGGHGYSPRAGPMMPPLPDHPPFKAYIGNVPFDIDEEVVDHFFRGLQISDIMVTRHRDTGRAKGCFVEFASQQDLKNALTMNGADLLRRAVSIQVAEPKHGGGGGGGGARGGGRDRDSYFGGGGGARGGDRRISGGGGGYSRFDEDRSDSRGRWNQVRDVPLVEPSSPRERPKLILQPRRAAEDAGGAASGAGEDGGAKPNPFGGARPANTAAKLQELEEKDRQRRADAAVARAAAKAAVEGGGARESKGDGAADRQAPAVEQIRERTEPHRPPPPGLSQVPGGGGGGRGRGDRRDRERGGGDRRGGSGRGGQRERGSGAGGEPSGLSHHRQGDSGRGGRGGRGRGGGGGGGGEKTEKAAAAAAAAAPPPPRIVAAPGEDAVPKTKVSNPFDLLGDE